MSATSSVSAVQIDSNAGQRIPKLHSVPPGSRGEIVMRAQAGCHDAFSELYALHNRRVYATCMKIVHDASLAEDLTQETFLQVYRKIGSFHGDSMFTTWLHRLAVNSALMHLRKRVLSLISLDQPIGEGSDEPAGRTIGCRDLHLAGTVDRIAINGAVADLAPGYRHVYILHDVHGYDHGEIASMLNCTRGNTKSQLHKARRNLRAALGSGTGGKVGKTAMDTSHR